MVVSERQIVVAAFVVEVASVHLDPLIAVVSSSLRVSAAVGDSDLEATSEIVASCCFPWELDQVAETFAVAEDSVGASYSDRAAGQAFVAIGVGSVVAWVPLRLWILAVDFRPHQCC